MAVLEQGKKRQHSIVLKFMSSFMSKIFIFNVYKYITLCDLSRIFETMR